jgi:hypothetical protein
MNHILRNFLYLDTQLVDDYLSSIEGGLYEETIVEKTQSVGGGNIEGGIEIFKGNGKKESTNGTEVTKQVRKTDSANFQRLYVSAGTHTVSSKTASHQTCEAVFFNKILLLRFSLCSCTVFV